MAGNERKSVGTRAIKGFLLRCSGLKFGSILNGNKGVNFGFSVREMAAVKEV